MYILIDITNYEEFRMWNQRFADQDGKQYCQHEACKIKFDFSEFLQDILQIIFMMIY